MANYVDYDSDLDTISEIIFKTTKANWDLNCQTVNRTSDITAALVYKKSGISSIMAQLNLHLNLTLADLAEEVLLSVIIKIVKTSKILNVQDYRGRNVLGVNLSHGKLTDIPLSIFGTDPVINLILDLSYNLLPGVPQNLSHLLRFVVVLNLEQNEITSSELHPYAFENAAKLEILNLANNKLTCFDKLITKKLAALRYLNLENNLLETFEHKIIVNNKKLEHLNLKNNIIKNIDTLTFDIIRKRQIKADTSENPIQDQNNYHPNIERHCFIFNHARTQNNEEKIYSTTLNSLSGRNNMFYGPPEQFFPHRFEAFEIFTIFVFMLLMYRYFRGLVNN